jgi:hypothetical protein
MAMQPYVIKSLPGIKRDGTRLENGFYVDGQWCRFQRGLPRKIGGYNRITNKLPELCRGVNTFNEDGTLHIASGGQSYLTQIELNPTGVLTGIFDRTPSGFAANPNHLWTFDVSYDALGVNKGAYLLAHPGVSLNDIDTAATSPIYYGFVNDIADLIVNPTAPAVSGGVVTLYPYTIVYGSNGFVAWSVPNKPDDFTSLGSGQSYITAQKIVAALPLRAGAGNSPAGLFWSLDSLCRATFVGGDTVFQFDTISSQSSILSQQTPIEYDGIYYWVGTDRFLMFNGVVREVPNQLNQNWFFDNLNYNYRQKVYSFKVPRYGEIWFCYPRGSATECTHAVIYNVRENTWYDTELPNGGLTMARFANVFQYPISFGLKQDTVTNQYKVWQNEIGYDEIDGQQVNSIPSWFETADIAAVADPNNPKMRSLRCGLVEPDFVQSGDMTCQITGRANARSPDQPSEIKTFPALADVDKPEEQVLFFKDIRREMRFKFTSNTVGGNYQMGQCIAHIDISDGTTLG